MPVTYISFAPTTTPTTITTETTVEEIRLLRGLLDASKCTFDSVANVTATRRDRAPRIVPVEIATGVKGAFKQLVKFGGGEIKLTTETDIAYFVNAVPVAPPKGVMGLASIDRIIDPNVVAVFNGCRLIKGDLIPVYFHVQGQRLTGLEGKFKAKQRRILDGSTPITLEKTSIVESAPALDERTGIEIMTGNFAIEPTDTDGFPDYEVEMVYQFLLSDGQGRTYTVATGYFTVYPPL